MVSDTLEQRIYELVRSHDGIYLFKKKELTPSTDLDSDLRLEDDEALALMDDFFTTFNVDRGNFSITTYYPPEPPLKHLLNPFRKNDIPQAPEFTIGMLIASARAGRWLYDCTLGGCFSPSAIMVRIMYIMLNAPEHLKDMLKRLDSCMSKNFWPISLIPSLP